MVLEAHRKLARPLAACLSACLMGTGCAGVPSGPAQYEYFAAPTADDQWSPKIAGWQRRERAADRVPVIAPAPVSQAASEGARVSLVPGRQPEPEPESVLEDEPELMPRLEPARPAPVAIGPDLRSKYTAFRAEQKRAMARSVADWTQGQALVHYVDDGPIDHWATLEETLRNNGDDCDGLELLTFHALRGLGFEMSEVFRAIVFRASDGQHHMVTLWFEDPEDPWVIDPTGAMTLGMPRMSDLPGWVPIKLFSDTEEYTVSLGASDPEPDTVLADNR